MLELATKLWGEPTDWSHDKNEVRFGSRQSKRVLLREMVWKDEEGVGANGGGGYIKLFGMAYPGELLPPRTDGPAKPKTNGKGNGHDHKRLPPWENVGPQQYDYRDADGKLVLQVFRTINGIPRFFQRAPNGSYASGEIKWTYKVRHIDGHDALLYRLPELLNSRDATVFVCEGEKDVDNLTKLGLIATCNIGGAGKWRAEYARYFLRKHIIVLADNDQPGVEHAATVARSLHPSVASIKILMLPGLLDKGDVSDWLRDGGTRDELEYHAREAPLYVPPVEPEMVEEEGGGEPPAPPPPTDDDGPTGRPTGKEVIACIAGEMPRMARQAEAALIKAGVQVYQRHKLVRPVEEEYDAAEVDGVKRKTHSAALLAYTPASLFKLLSEVATFQKFNVKAKAFVSCEPPDKLVQILLDGKGDWTFPHIRGVLTCPTLRADGSVLKDRGYDPASRYYLAMPSNLVMPDMPDAPTREDAEAALARLGALLVRFPFVDEVSRAVAYCILMTQVLRCAMQVSPMLAVSATAPSSGKSFLVDLASAIALGRPCPVIPPGKNEEETEKGIRTKLISGTPAFSIDNIHQGINMPLLNMATERTHISIRLFSVLEEVEVENSVVIYSTGNNLAIIDEQGRRTIRCCMDSGEERPEFRTFDVNPIDTVMADRGAYIADILTIARAYARARAEGLKRPDIPPMGDSHKTWSRLVREPLVWLGLEDPLKSQDITRQDDPVSGRLGALIDAWHLAFGMEEKTLAEAAKYATTIPTKLWGRDKEENEINQQSYDTHREYQEGLLGALRDGFAAGKDGVNTHAWGNWMRKFEGRMSGGLKFVRAEGKLSHGTARWKLTKA